MGFHLIAATSSLNWVWIVLQVAFGLGMVIFVHELGHFAVAKLCGVKCEKFYLGFDIYGLKILRFRWGETEYGIGILPLGGYVKMLGQDDNPARAAQERERAKLQGPEGIAAGDGEALDPRSYMAQSVPRRMAIISAGVIMNVIFAVLMAAIAYGMGVQDLACGIQALIPGDAAWRSNLQPCDQILAIEGRPAGQQLRFRDLTAAVALADLEQGVRFKVKRHGVPEPFWMTIHPDPAQKKKGLAPTIGALSPVTTTLRKEIPTVPGSAAHKTGKFRGGDTIVEVDGQPIEDHCDLTEQLTNKSDRAVDVTVRRKIEKVKDKPQTETETIKVPPQPLRVLGLVMKMGSITAVQKDSPAVKAGIQAGDRLLSIDGQDVVDPLTLDERLRRRAGETISLTLKRKGRQEPVAVQATLRKIGWLDEPWPGSPASALALGIAYEVHNVVASIEPDSPAAKATAKNAAGKPAGGLKAGDVVAKAEFIYPKEPGEELPEQRKLKELKFGERQNWPFFMNTVQSLPSGTDIKLILADDRSVILTPAASNQWFNAERGFLFEPDMIVVKAHSAGEAFSLALRETKDQLSQVYRFLQKIFQRQISPYGFAGPVTIFKVAGRAANEGVADLLIFLTMLSANLAVINFLPIPLLDGGHMVFLLLEAIFRKPVSEKVVVAFHYAGFIFIVSLMLFVLSLDLGLISRYAQ